TNVAGSSFNGKGSIRWQAPELLAAVRFDDVEEDDVKVTDKSDIYAFASVCLEVFTGEVPFSNLRDGMVLRAIVIDDRRPARPTGPATQRGLDDSMWGLLQDCWQTNPSRRPDMKAVLLRLPPHDAWTEVVGSFQHSAIDFLLKPLDIFKLPEDNGHFPGGMPRVDSPFGVDLDFFDDGDGSLNYDN
ncbi:hypothetical protein BD410DRAFT_846677, partial [Rickenella mellea]